MARRDIDAFVATNSSNITYLTGYTAKSAYVPCVGPLIVEPHEVICVRRVPRGAEAFAPASREVKLYRPKSGQLRRGSAARGVTFLDHRLCDFGV
ncbi:aminopeptidase P family N-terminal domain-containing protein [Bradyrhizobium sp. CCBAU 45394]|uniref:aminopeptidase P family N-terminal domain-containing protein n=1 Tax=Bradyrhizobium sp. CCBAU 45394 TaxID=1325087 RepID=UPI00230482E0|nr:aminopeptidase P family N-terminal domain-containing protein [Bradyrhizobium sp. CCBAU 45394]